jgi:hypothetical protein
MRFVLLQCGARARQRLLLLLRQTRRSRLRRCGQRAALDHTPKPDHHAVNAFARLSRSSAAQYLSTSA